MTSEEVPVGTIGKLWFQAVSEKQVHASLPAITVRNASESGGTRYCKIQSVRRMLM